ncbi:MAG TPA: hypothetical protein VF937_06560, partial [Chloroflexota bacterium]
FLDDLDRRCRQHEQNDQNNHDADQLRRHGMVPSLARLRAPERTRSALAAIVCQPSAARRELWPGLNSDT